MASTRFAKDRLWNSVALLFLIGVMTNLFLCGVGSAAGEQPTTALAACCVAAPTEGWTLGERFTVQTQRIAPGARV